MYRIIKICSHVIIGAVIGLFSLQSFADGPQGCVFPPPKDGDVCCHGQWQAPNQPCQPFTDKEKHPQKQKESGVKTKTLNVSM